MLKLTGIQADNPQGWMAAIGIMMILAKQNKQASLAWDNLTPILYHVTEDALIEALVTYQNTPNHLTDELGVIPVNPQNNKIMLDFTAGKVNFSDVLTRMTQGITQQQIKDALFLPWHNCDNIVSLGWDPKSVKQAATLAGENAPDKAKHKTVLVGQWLAAESLLLTCPLPRQQKTYSWITWSTAVDLEGIQAIIQSSGSCWEGLRFTSKIAFSGNFKFFLPSTIVL